MFLFAPLVPLFVGRGFSQSVNAIRWLCLIPVFRCFHLSAGDAISGAGYQKFRLTSQASGTSPEANERLAKTQPHPYPKLAFGFSHFI
jgi:O-antigen/teichoic acid export membrane protein